MQETKILRSELYDDLLRYCRQVVLKTMDRVRGMMRGSDRLLLREITAGRSRKAQDNLTKGIDQDAENLIVQSLQKKMNRVDPKMPFIVISEELGVATFPKETLCEDVDLVFLIDPIDGTEFIETLQGGWSLMTIYSRRSGRVIGTVAGDIFLNRLYWAGTKGPAECLDFVTHSWFKLDGGPNPKNTLTGARVNVLTTKVPRFRAVARETALLDALEKAGARINLSWGSNMVVQVAAGYADVAIEFAKGFSTYDILPGIFLAEKAGLTILDMDGRQVSSRVSIDPTIRAHRSDPTNLPRQKFIAAKDPRLAHDVLDLLSPTARTRALQPSIREWFPG